MYRPTSPRTPNGSSIGSAFFARLALVTIIHTGTHRPCYVCSNRPHLVLCIPTQSKMKNRFKCICCRNYSIGKLVSYYQLSHNSLLEVSRYFTVFLFETNLLKFLVFVLPFAGPFTRISLSESRVHCRTVAETLFPAVCHTQAPV